MSNFYRPRVTLLRGKKEEPELVRIRGNLYQKIDDENLLDQSQDLGKLYAQASRTIARLRKTNGSLNHRLQIEKSKNK